MTRTTRGRNAASTPEKTDRAAVDGNPATPRSTSDTPRSASLAVGREEVTAGRAVVTSFVAVGAHVFWIFAGPVVLVLLLINIVLRRSGSLSTSDAVYFLVAAAVFACRWIDQRTGQATTSTGELATWTDFRRYATRLPPVAIGTWIVVKLVSGWLG
jgi:hypothetical protein